MLDLIVLFAESLKCNWYCEVLFTRRFVKAALSSSGRSVRVLSCSTVLQGIAQLIGGSQRLLSLLLRSGVQIEPLCLHTEPIHSLMVSNNLKDWPQPWGLGGKGWPNVSVGFNSEWEKRCVHVLGSVMRDKVNRIPERPAVVHEQGFVLWVRFSDWCTFLRFVCDQVTTQIFQRYKHGHQQTLNAADFHFQRLHANASCSRIM